MASRAARHFLWRIQLFAQERTVLFFSIAGLFVFLMILLIGGSSDEYSPQMHSMASYDSIGMAAPMMADNSAGEFMSSSKSMRMSKRSPMAGRGMMMEAAQAPQFDGSAEMDDPSGGGGSPDQAEDIPDERVLIKTVYVSASVDDVKRTRLEIETIASSLKGNIFNVQFYGGKHSISSLSMVVKVPADALDKFLTLTRDLKDFEVESENMSTDDVTDQYVDTVSRLNNLEVSLTQLTALMGKAMQVGDIITLQRELTRVTEQIEVMKGRKNYFEKSSAMSTVTFSLRERRNDITNPERPPFWRPGRTLGNAIDHLLQIVAFFLDAGIWIVVFLVPSAAILGPIVYLVFFRKPKSNGHAASESTNSSKLGDHGDSGEAGPPC